MEDQIQLQHVTSEKQMLTKIDVKGFLRIIKAFNTVLTIAASTVLRGGKKLLIFVIFLNFLFIFC